MNECFRCGVSGERVRLYDAVSDKGIVKICGECNAMENLPIIKRPTTDQIAESQRQKSVRDMLAGVNKTRLARREMSLRELVDKNLKERLARQPSDLIDNFHWTIQRARRNKKITREQFAKGIGESEATVRMLEQGILPNNDYKLINKVESYLGVGLKKQGSSNLSEFQEKSQPPKTLDFDRETTSRLKIADLREMKRRQEESKEPIDSWEEKRNEFGDIEEEINEISDEELFDEE
jgi:ribosome-binding protein aMBF1 (putative translation factor)